VPLPNNVSTFRGEGGWAECRCSAHGGQRFASAVGQRFNVSRGWGLTAISSHIPRVAGAAAEWARKHGVRKLELHVFPHNEAAIALCVWVVVRRLICDSENGPTPQTGRTREHRTGSGRRFACQSGIKP